MFGVKLEGMAETTIIISIQNVVIEGVKTSDYANSGLGDEITEIIRTEGNPKYFLAKASIHIGRTTISADLVCIYEDKYIAARSDKPQKRRKDIAFVAGGR